MEFYVIAYKYQEDIFFNVHTLEDTHDLNEKCFFPTRPLATQYIEEALSTDYEVLLINLLSLEPNGVWGYTREEFPAWDESFDDDSEFI